MSKIDLLLSGLSKVKSTGAGKWIALCPAHDDRNPSLGVKLTTDEKILIRCWAGCALEDILHALNLEITDLFPDPPEKPDYRRHRRGDKPGTPRFSRYELFPKLVFEANILVIAVNDLLAGQTLDDADLARVRQAMDTILALRVEVD